jgi:hypothetical protein
MGCWVTHHPQHWWFKQNQPFVHLRICGAGRGAGLLLSSLCTDGVCRPAPLGWEVAAISVFLFQEVITRNRKCKRPVPQGLGPEIVAQSS